MREAPYETVVAAGLACVDEVLEAERNRLCEARYRQLGDMPVAARRACRELTGAGCCAGAAGVLEAEHGFRKIAGYRAMLTLVACLRAHDAKTDPTSLVDDAEQGP